MQLDARALAIETAEIVRRHVATATAPLLKRIEAIEARPAPERGEKGDRGDSGEAGAPGRDGVGLAGAIIDRSGVLVLTLTDGTTRELGMVVGKDGASGPVGERGEPGEKGEPGERGETGLAGETGAAGADGADGQPGRDGRDGKDGFGFDDLAVEQEGERGFKLVFAQGDARKEFEFVLPVVLDRGVFKADREEPYQAGDAVSWGGSLWIAQRETTAKPDSPDSGWRLAVKRGRDGKDAKA